MRVVHDVSLVESEENCNLTFPSASTIVEISFLILVWEPLYTVATLHLIL